VEDDGSKKFAAIYEAVQNGETLRRVEKAPKKRGSGKGRSRKS